MRDEVRVGRARRRTSTSPRSRQGNRIWPSTPLFPLVMAGLVPAIHVFSATRKQDVDARHKAGHDEVVIALPSRGGWITPTVHLIPSLRPTIERKEITAPST